MTKCQISLARSPLSLEEVKVGLPSNDHASTLLIMTGIGYGCTHTLLTHGISKLFVTSRRSGTGHEALDAIEKDLGKDARSRVVYIQNDLSDWTQTAKAANEIAKQTDRIDILINNAARGIMSRQLAETNGTDLHMAGNHMVCDVSLQHLSTYSSVTNRVMSFSPHTCCLR